MKLKQWTKEQYDEERQKQINPALGDISVARLIDDGLLVLYREMKELLSLSSSGKLDAANARDLRDHLKLLFELKDREGDSLKNLSDDELKAKVQEALSVSDAK